MFKRSNQSVWVALVLAIVVVGSVATPASAAPSEWTVHIVRRGETLYRIALSYGVSVGAIAQANGIANPNRIYAGQRLVIPTGYAGGGRYTGTVHVVRRGETLYRIALNHGVSMWAIARANNVANPNRIYAGQRLVIP